MQGCIRHNRGPAKAHLLARATMSSAPAHRMQTEKGQGNAHRSEPARSTKLSLPRVTFCVCRLVDEMMIDTIRWLRLDSRFICRAG